MNAVPYRLDQFYLAALTLARQTVPLTTPQVQHQSKPLALANGGTDRGGGGGHGLHGPAAQDGVTIIDISHLGAALAVFAYCEAPARAQPILLAVYVFMKLSDR
jgi:hypothetical protein